MIIQLKGLPLFIRDIGHGPHPLLFFHGWAMSSDSWDALIPYFDLSRYRLLLPDVRGFGRSGKPLEGYHIDDYMRDGVRLLRKLGISKATVIGHSFGGTGALYLAARLPHLVHRVVVFDTIPGAASPSIDPRTRQQFASILELVERTTPERLNRLLMRIWRQAFAIEPSLSIRKSQQAAAELAEKHAIRATLHTILDTDITNWLPRLKPAVLIFRGDLDPMLHEDPDPLTAIPNHARHVITECGHYPHIEQPAQVWRHLGPFLNEL